MDMAGYPRLVGIYRLACSLASRDFYVVSCRKICTSEMDMNGYDWIEVYVIGTTFRTKLLKNDSSIGYVGKQFRGNPTVQYVLQLLSA
jgi:hypothetical protein